MTLPDGTKITGLSAKDHRALVEAVTAGLASQVAQQMHERAAQDDTE